VLLVGLNLLVLRTHSSASGWTYFTLRLGEGFYFYCFSSDIFCTFLFRDLCVEELGLFFSHCIKEKSLIKSRKSKINKQSD